MAFPTLTSGPNSVSIARVDDTISSPVEAGYVQTRSRTTRKLYLIDVSYLLNESDKVLLMAHDDSVKCVTIFSWTNFKTNVTYSVKYVKPVTCSTTVDINGYYKISFQLRTV